MKKIIAIIMTFMLAFTTFGLIGCSCGGSSDAFTVYYYPGGYGAEWLDEFVKEFVAKKKYDGDVSKVTSEDYKLTPRSDIGSNSRIILNGKNCPDIMMANGIENQDISDDLVANISDVYEMEVATSNGNIKIKDYIMPESMMTFSRQFLPGQGDVVQWAIPWTAIPLSLAYNETLLNKINHTTSGNVGNCVDAETGKWIKAPTTFEELMTCFADIKAQGTVDGNAVKAFGFSTVDGALWFESLIYIWWAQYQGLNTPKISGEYQDAFYDFFNLDNYKKYNQQGIVKALEHIQQLITVNGGTADGAFDLDNIYGDPTSNTIKDVQPAFARGETVFCLTGDFFAKEYKEILDDNKDNVNAKLMPVPAYDSTHNENYTFLNTTSCMYVPAKAKHLDMAKEFLAFINDEAHLVRFTELTGGIRPFGTNSSESKAAIKQKYLAAKDWGDFEKSTFDVYFDCDDVVLTFPRNYKTRGRDGQISFVYTYESERMLTPDYPTLINSLRKNSVSYLVNDETNANSLIKNAYNRYLLHKDSYGDTMITSIQVQG